MIKQARFHKCKTGHFYHNQLKEVEEKPKPSSYNHMIMYEFYLVAHWLQKNTKLEAKKAEFAKIRVLLNLSLKLYNPTIAKSGRRSLHTTVQLNHSLQSIDNNKLTQAKSGIRSLHTT